MAFPRQGPNQITVSREIEVGRDAQGNRSFDLTPLVQQRKGRFYRDQGREQEWARNGVTVTGFAAMHWQDNDPMFGAKDVVTLYGHQFPDDGEVFGIRHVRLAQLWSKPSHWEFVLGTVR